MSFLTLEILPNEILMLIFQYSGDAPSVLQAFLGLNQRFNLILLGRELHLLTDYLSLKPLDKYYSSDEFQQATRQLLPIRTSIIGEKLGEILRPLIGYSIRQRYCQLIDNFQLLREKSEYIRQTFSENELCQVDHEIEKEFFLLDKEPVTIGVVKQVKELVFRKGARLQRERNRLDYYAFIEFFKHLISPCINSTMISLNLYLTMHSKLAQIFLISNPDLIDNRMQTDIYGYDIEHYLLDDFFSLRADEGYGTLRSVNVRCFRAILDLFFLTFYFRSATLDSLHTLFYGMLYALDVTCTPPSELYVRTAQVEITKFVFEQCHSATIDLDCFERLVLPALKNLITNKRFDIFEHLSHHPSLRTFLNNSNNIQQLINLFTYNQASRQVFERLMGDPVFELFFSQQRLLFVLLEKKEQVLLEQLLMLYPDKINQLDDEGNDPLLYITLYGFGRRDHIIEMLMRKGSDPERINLAGETFRDVLRLTRNRGLLKMLIKYKIV